MAQFTRLGPGGYPIAVSGSTATAAGAAAGAAAVAGVGLGSTASVGAVAAVAAVAGVGNGLIPAVGTAAGAAGVSAVAIGITTTVGAAAGAASVSGIGADTDAAPGAAAGKATVSAVGLGSTASVGAAAGKATVAAVGVEAVAGAGAAAGRASAGAAGIAGATGWGMAAGIALVLAAGMNDASLPVYAAPVSYAPVATPAYLFPAIPDTGTTDDELRATVDSLKEAVELLSGVNANGMVQAVTPIQLAALMGTTPQAVRAGAPNWGVFDTLQGKVGNVRKALIATKTELSNAQTNLIASYTAGDKALAGTIATVSHAVEGNSAAITSETLARSTADSALATNITTVSAVASRQRTFTSVTAPSYTPPDAAIVGDIWIDTAHQNSLKVWDGHAWTAYDNAQIGVNTAAISTEATARATADTAMAANITTLTTRVGTAESAVSTETTARTTADSALSGQITNITSTLYGSPTGTPSSPGAGSVMANVNTTASTLATTNSALSSLTTSVTSLNNTTTAGGYYRLTSEAGTNGALAEFAMQVSATNDGTGWGTAGIVLQAMGSGASRVKINSSQFIVDNGVAPFTIIGGELRFGGKIYGSDIVAGTVSADQITANTITTNQITAGGVDVVALAQNAATKIDVTQTKLSDVPFDGNAHVIAQLNFTSIGSDYFIIASVDVDSNWGSTTSAVMNVFDTTVRLIIDGAIAREILLAATPYEIYWNGSGVTSSWRTKGHFEVMYKTTLGAGEHTLQIQGIGATARNATANLGGQPTIVAIELRR